MDYKEDPAGPVDNWAEGQLRKGDELHHEFRVCDVVAVRGPQPTSENAKNFIVFTSDE